MNPIETARRQQIAEMRASATGIRAGIKKAREQAEDWQRKADEARALIAVLTEKARVWDLLADSMDTPGLDHIVVPLGDSLDMAELAANKASHRAAGIRRAHPVLGAILDAMPSGFEGHCWSIETTASEPACIKIQQGSGVGSDDQARDGLRSVAAVLGLTYGEKDNGRYTHLSASGQIDGVDVEVWDHAKTATTATAAA